MPQDIHDDKSTLVQVLGWFCEASAIDDLELCRHQITKSYSLNM